MNPSENQLEPSSEVSEEQAFTGLTYTEPALAWRTWIVGDREFVSQLFSVTRGGYSDQSKDNSMRNKWPFKQPMEAICRPGKTHKSPVEDCTCGIYGTIDFFEAADWLDWNKRNTHLELQTVIGLVKFWGNVIEYDSGFKAQYAYPSEIWIPPNSWYKAGTMKSTERMAREIQMAYGIPAQAIDDITEVTDYDRNLAGQHEVVNSEWLLGREC